MKKLFGLIPAVPLAMVVFASHPAAAANAVTVVGTINGGGTALMTSGPGAGGKSVTSFAIHATLYSDGNATGHVERVAPKGDTLAGKSFRESTRWSMGPRGPTLVVTGK